MMSEEDTEGFVAWEEHIISPEKGNRVIHFFLRDSMGHLVLAVEGTERSVRHMVYVVSNRFVEEYGDVCCVKAGTKWQARRDVVDWLSSLVSRHQAQACELVQPIHDQTWRSNGHHNRQPFELGPRKLEAQSSDIAWHGVSWACTKQLRHYPAFCRNGITFSVHSFVFIMAAEGSHYLGYLEDMYEDKKQQKKVRVRWFHRDDGALGIESQLKAHPREVFITPQVHVISAECIDGPAAVLTPKHYEQCMAVIPKPILSKVHMCFRQLKNNKIRPFSLSKLQGYVKQAVLSCLDHPLFSNNRIKAHNFTEDKRRTSTFGVNMKKGHKRKRLHEVKDEDYKESNSIRRSSESNRLRPPEASANPSALGRQIGKDVPSYRRLKIKLSGRVLKHDKFIKGLFELSASFKINDEIELLSQDSGIRGCWFRCKVLQVSGNRLKVEYDDVQDAEGFGNLQEWVASCRVADPDKLGQRCSGRLTARPRPPEYSTDFVLDVGAPVDVWWCDGWWEGVVVTGNMYETDHVQVYLPGEDRYLTIERSHVRTARDWINGSWVNAKMKPDILSCLYANASPSISRYALPPISELDEVEQDGQHQSGTATHDTGLTSNEDTSTSKQDLQNQEKLGAEDGKNVAKELVSSKVDADAENDEMEAEKKYFEFAKTAACTDDVYLDIQMLRR